MVLEDGNNTLPIGTVVVATGLPPLLDPAPGVRIEGRPVTAPIELDADGTQALELDGRLYQLGRRRDRIIVRVRDPQAAALRDFRGIPTYDIDLAYRVEVRFEPIDPPRLDLVGTTDGGEDQLPCVGLARFVLAGTEQALGIYQESGGRLVVPFKDASNLDETYGGGRMLYVERPARGSRWVLDFNLAFNPPCAFNDLVACPLPPAGNRLTVAVRAGERRPQE
jgi:uncharacterized protein